MLDKLMALAMLVASAVYLGYALRLPLGSTARPGPGFYPAAVGGFACLVALVVVALAFRRLPGLGVTGGEALDERDRRRVALAVITLAGFCMALPWIGYPLAALLFVAVLFRQLGARWPAAWLTAVLSAEGSYYLFATVLGVTLPRGFWPH